MKVETHDIDGVRVIELGGKITIGAGDIKLRETIDGSLADGHKEILLDLEKVSAIDSSGIGEMVACYTSVANRGGHLKLVNLSPKINDILQVTQLITVFDVFDDRAEALASFTA